MSLFPLYVKSTIDFIASSLALANSYEFFDLDAAAWESELVKSQNPAMAWALSTVSEHPIDPLWQVSFDIGAKVGEDPAQYTSLEIVSIILGKFFRGNSIPIMNYSQAGSPSKVEGSLIVTSANAIPSQFDKTTGLRIVRVEARAIRFP